MIICTSGDCLNKICGHRRCTGSPLWCAGHSARLPSRFCQGFCLIRGGRIVQKFCSEWKSRQFSPIYDHRRCFLKKKLQKCLFSQLTALIFWLGSVSRSYQPVCVAGQMKVAPGWLAEVVTPVHTSSQSASPGLPEMLRPQLDAWKGEKKKNSHNKAYLEAPLVRFSAGFQWPLTARL